MLREPITAMEAGMILVFGFLGWGGDFSFCAPCVFFVFVLSFLFRVSKGVLSSLV
jgi:hypothetical protein